MRTVLAIALLLACASIAPGATPAAGEVTIKGIMLSTWHFYKHAAQGPSADPKKGFDLVIYAFDGPPEMQATLREVLAAYPARGLDAAAATALQEQFDTRLLYHIDTGDPASLAKLILSYTWINIPASVTGTLEVKDGKRWLRGAKVTVEDRKALGFTYPPQCMLLPDHPFVTSQEKPIVLNIADGLTLKCVPIPPGTFIMGSPFYQMPRYQDECPHEVTLTKTFCFSEIPITQEMWEAVMGKEANRSRNRAPQFAVEDSPFPDIREFCRRVSAKNERTVRVPTAAELEYVGRLGTSNPCFPPKYRPQRTDVASRKGCVPVKTKAPNAWGIYDLPAFGITATSDWKSPNLPGKQVDPQGEPLDSPWVYFDSAIRSTQKQDRPVENMIMISRNGSTPNPAVHKGAAGLDWDRPNMHDRYSEDGLDGGNGSSWMGIFRVVVEAGP